MDIRTTDIYCQQFGSLKPKPQPKPFNNKKLTTFKSINLKLHYDQTVDHLNSIQLSRVRTADMSDFKIPFVVTNTLNI